MWCVEAKMNFIDIKADVKRHTGERFYVSTERLKELLWNNKAQRRLVEPVSFYKEKQNPGNKIVIFHQYLYYIGGIETFLYNFVKRYKDKNITIMYEIIDDAQLFRLSQFCNLEKWDGHHHECDTLVISNYNSSDVATRFKAKKIYQMVHCDWRALKQYPYYKDFMWKVNPKVDKIIAVSETALDGIKESFGYDGEVIVNMLDPDGGKNDPLVFITLSRMSIEKGSDRILEMAKRFKDAGKKFIWLLCCSLEQSSPAIQKKFRDMEEFVIIKPDWNNKALIKKCDYLVQLSDTESFCYSAYEALQRNVPVILTDFPEAYNIVKPGKNGYIVSRDLSDLDIDKIFNNVPKEVSYVDRCDYDKWEQVFEGRL